MTEEETPPEPTPPPEEPPQETPDSLITKANEAAERLEGANKKLEGLLNRQEEQQVENTLAGTAHAGTQKQTKEQKQVASAKKMLEGTGFEDMLDMPK